MGNLNTLEPSLSFLWQSIVSITDSEMDAVTVWLRRSKCCRILVTCEQKINIVMIKSKVTDYLMDFTK